MREALVTAVHTAVHNGYVVCRQAMHASEVAHLRYVAAASCEVQLLFASVEPFASDWRQAGNLALEVVAMKVAPVVLLQSLLVCKVCARCR